MRNILAGSRFFIAIAVFGTFLSSVALIVSGTISVVKVIWNAIRDGDTGVDASKHMAIDFLQLVDIFLLGTALYIIALGLYELFIDDSLPMPKWLIIATFEDLKEKLIGVIIVLLGVSYLGTAVTWTGGGDILNLGVATGAIILSLAIALYLSSKSHPLPPPSHEPTTDEQGAHITNG
jgi:uncharacterized membrane protein YqhA